MPDADLNFRNILVIDFGQLGDVVLSLPALRAIRTRFPDARITLLIGRPGADIIRIAKVSDAQLVVDRVALRDGPKLSSIAQILRLVGQVRALRFDLVIDLHSLWETNILGFLSGSPWRLYASRENRSIDWLGRFPTRPPREDISKHHVERYFDVLKPLGIEMGDATITIRPPEADAVSADEMLRSLGVGNQRLIGLFIGAGHPGRRWPIDKFVELARRLATDQQNSVLVFAGPEERDLRPGLTDRFGSAATVMDELPLVTFFAMLSRLRAFVSGDTGPMHLAALAGAAIVLISRAGAPDIFLPLSRDRVVLDHRAIDDLGVDEVEAAVKTFF